MSPEDMKLPELERAEFLSRGFLRKEWVIDNAFLSRLKTDVAINIIKARMEFLAECAKLEGQMKQLEAKMFTDISKTLK